MSLVNKIYQKNHIQTLSSAMNIKNHQYFHLFWCFLYSVFSVFPLYWIRKSKGKNFSHGLWYPKDSFTSFIINYHFRRFHLILATMFCVPYINRSSTIYLISSVADDASSFLIHFPFSFRLSFYLTLLKFHE